MVKDVVVDEGLVRRIKALAELEACSALEVKHFGLPVAWCLTAQVDHWPTHVPLPSSLAFGDIQPGEA
jgi:hypothetical protein